MRQELETAALPVVAPRPRTSRRLMTSDQMIAVALVAPSIIAIAVFVYGFIGRTAYISLVRWNDIAPT